MAVPCRPLAHEYFAFEAVQQGLFNLTRMDDLVSSVDEFHPFIVDRK